MRLLSCLLISGIFLVSSEKGTGVKNSDNHRYCDTLKLDSSICGAWLDNPSSIKKHLSGRIYDLLRSNNYKREQNSFPYFLFASNDMTQTLKITLFPGNDCCQVFSVSKNQIKNDIKKRNYLIRTKHREFITENGIKLGISKKKFFSIFKMDVFEHRIEDSRDVYKRILHPGIQGGYVAYYIFKNDKLEKYIFGNYLEEYNFNLDITN